MARLIYQESEVELAPDDTVLKALLRHGVDVPYSCTNGVCQSCIVRSDGAPPPANSQVGLKETLAAQGYFLACQCKAAEIANKELRVSLSGSETLFTQAILLEKAFVAPNVVQLTLEPQTPLQIEPGQFVHLRRDDGLVRSYSVASAPPHQRHLELHIGRVQDGQMSSYLIDELACGDAISIRGPSGNCFYVPGRPEQEMLLVGTGTGLAPLLGVLRSAILNAHTGPIHLFHGSVSPDGIYFVAELRALAAKNSNVHYYPCVDTAAPEKLAGRSLKLGRASDVALMRFQDLKGWRVFLCGHPEMVKSTKKRSYLAGASMSDIFADPFEIGAPTAT